MTELFYNTPSGIGKNSSATFSLTESYNNFEFLILGVNFQNFTTYTLSPVEISSYYSEHNLYFMQYDGNLRFHVKFPTSSSITITTADYIVYYGLYIHGYK